MHLLIYASPFNMAGRNLRKKIKSMGAGVQSTYIASVEELDKHLRNPQTASSVCILIPSDNGELAALIGIRHLLRDLRVILVLTDNQNTDTTAASAHRLRPRYISRADGDLSDVTAVIGKMKCADFQNPVHAVF